MGEAEKREPARNAAPSILGLALQVLRGELTEAEAIEILRRSMQTGDGDSTNLST
jgi:hypothetical protein